MALLPIYIAVKIAEGFRLLRGLCRERNGATAIEYGLIAAGVGIAVLLAVFSAGEELTNLFWHAWSEFHLRV